MEDLFLSIVIPAYNEAKRLDKTLEIIKDYLMSKRLRAEIIVVDDGSTDDTALIAKKYGVVVISYCPNMGKGFAVKTGMLKAKGKYVLFTDADLSTPVEELDVFLDLIKSSDIVIGSRGLADSNIIVHQPFFREYLGKIFNLLINLLVFRGIKDTQCGFKLFRKSVIEKIFSKQKIQGFGFDVEILYLARKQGLAVREVAVSWKNSRETKLNPLTDSIKMFYDVLRVKLYDLLGYYDW